MIQVAPQMRILVAIESVDLRKGIDGLAQLCREKLGPTRFPAACSFSIAGAPRRLKSWHTTGRVLDGAEAIIEGAIRVVANRQSLAQLATPSAA